MPIVIVHGGQTGVDRGAHLGAADAGLRVGGFMPNDERDELGRIPEDVAAALRRSRGGLRERTFDNLRIADAVLVVVEDAAFAPYQTPGTATTIIAARKLKLPRLVVDASWSKNRVVEWTAGLAGSQCAAAGNLSAELLLMVAGPRASKWADGERVARTFVAALR